MSIWFWMILLEIAIFRWVHVRHSQSLIFYLQCQNVYAPDQDPEMTVEHYKRNFAQNELLGLNDMKTEGYWSTDEAVDNAYYIVCSYWTWVSDTLHSAFLTLFKHWGMVCMFHSVRDITLQIITIALKDEHAVVKLVQQLLANVGMCIMRCGLCTHLSKVAELVLHSEIRHTLKVRK